MIGTGTDTYLGQATNLAQVFAVPCQWVPDTVQALDTQQTGAGERDGDGGEKQGRRSGRASLYTIREGPRQRPGIGSPFAQVEGPTSECKDEEACIRPLRLRCACKRLQAYASARWIATRTIQSEGFGFLLMFDSTSDDLETITSLPEFRPNMTLRHLNLQDSILGDMDTFAHNLFAIAPLTVGINGGAYELEDLGISPLLPPSIFYPQVEKIMWTLRRTRMRDQFAFLDKYVASEADLMNDFGKPLPPFPYVRFGETFFYRRR
ncbi:hypothetical protein C8T65DRAFT_696414 [Cerioporus squamosus]|nr:hypothetical protein C8T65DRAFT_696414 [Cerioporus squamosus]